jgi:hypothetical protein
VTEVENISIHQLRAIRGLVEDTRDRVGIVETRLSSIERRLDFVDSRLSRMADALERIEAKLPRATGGAS